MYIKYEGDNLLFDLVYVDEIIFGCTNDSFVQWFANATQSEFEMSMIGELSFFLGLCIIQSPEGSISLPREVFEGDVEEISNGKLITCQYTYGCWL